LHILDLQQIVLLFELKYFTYQIVPIELILILYFIKFFVEQLCDFYVFIFMFILLIIIYLILFVHFFFMFLLEDVFPPSKEKGDLHLQLINITVELLLQIVIHDLLFFFDQKHTVIFKLNTFYFYFLQNSLIVYKLLLIFIVLHQPLLLQVYL